MPDFVERIEAAMLPAGVAGEVDAAPSLTPAAPDASTLPAPRGSRGFLRRWLAPPPSYGRFLQTGAMGLLCGVPLGAVAGAASLACTATRLNSSEAFFAALVGASVGSLAGPAVAWVSLLARSSRLGAALGSLLGGLAGSGFGAWMASTSLNGHTYGLPAAPALPLAGAVTGIVGGLAVSALVGRLQAQSEAAAQQGRGLVAGTAGAAGTALRSGADEDALSHQVRRAGRIAVSLRFLVPTVAAVGTMAWQVREASSMGMGFWHLFTGVQLALYFGGLLLPSFVLAMLYRHFRQRQLRRRLAALPPEAQEAVLAPLVDPRSPETREIAAPLLRELRSRAPTEILPASAPAGRGAEVTGAEALGESRGGSR